MSDDLWKLEDDLCRCCHSEGSFKSLSEKHSFGNEAKIYVDMLRYALDVNITPVQGALYAPTYTICEPCILRLQEATSFKRQVLHCEEKFKDMYIRNFIKVAADVQIKEETPEGESKDIQEDQPFDDADDDFHIKDDVKDYISKKVKQEGKKRAKITLKKSKSQMKTKKPSNKSCLKKTEEEIVMKKNGEGGKASAAPKFRLQENDYRKEGDLFMCSHCEKRYDKLCSLKFHVKTKHYKIPRYLCPYCMKEFMTPTPLTVHKLEEHNIDDRFKCNACKGTFNTKVQLRKHKNIFHMLGERYKCEFCDYESFSFEGVYKHKFKHKTVKDYHCRFCKKSFLRKTTLDLHERIHTGDRRKVCKVCSQTFVQKASLNYHMTKYHPEVNF